MEKTVKPTFTTLQGGFNLAPSGKVYVDKGVNVFTMCHESLKEFAKNARLNFEKTGNKYFEEVFNYYDNFCVTNPMCRIKFAEIVYKNSHNAFFTKFKEFKKWLTNNCYFAYWDNMIQGVYNKPADKQDIVYVSVENQERILNKYHFSVFVHFPEKCTLRSDDYRYITEKGIKVPNFVKVDTERGVVFATMFNSATSRTIHSNGSEVKINFNKLTLDEWESGSKSLVSDYQGFGRSIRSMNLSDIYDIVNNSEDVDDFTEVELEEIKRFSEKAKEILKEDMKGLTIVQGVEKYYPTLEFDRWDIDPNFEERMQEFYSVGMIELYKKLKNAKYCQYLMPDNTGCLRIRSTEWIELNYSYRLPVGTTSIVFEVTLKEYDDAYDSEDGGYLPSKEALQNLRKANPSLKEIFINII